MVTAVDVRQVRAVAETVTDPELPMLTLADLGVLRAVEVTESGQVIVSITPTYSGCPAIGAMRADLIARLRESGHPDVEVRTVLQPAWTTDWITDAGRKKLADNGIAPPGPAATRPSGAIPLTLAAPVRHVSCPLCGSADTIELSAFSATACKALRRCRACQEPFEHIKEI